jgi:hydroxypyruvate reductase
MAGAALRVLGPRVRAGLVVGLDAAPLPAPLEAVAAGHPVPSPASERAGRRALAMAAVDDGAALLVLLSGGASALLAVPADGVTLEDKCRTTERLLRAGVDIHALNTVRKHLSGIKGGWLAAKAAAPGTTLALSDVVGDELSVIGSGPTVADPTTFADALDVLRRTADESGYPPAVVARLASGARGEQSETPKPGAERLARHSAAVVGGRRDAMRGAADAARARGYDVRVVEAPVVGEAREAAAACVAQVAALAADRPRPFCVVSSGETTVRLTGPGGCGGRNQEFVLAAAATLDRLGPLTVAASIGTDGVDGPTDAAGAVADPTTPARARRAGVAPEASLERHDSYAFFAALGDLVLTGPTGTNVGDLQVFLLA